MAGFDNEKSEDLGKPVVISRTGKEWCLFPAVQDVKLGTPNSTKNA